MEFEAGKYYVGDLCYVIKNELWDDLCEADMPTEFMGQPIFMEYTAYGDGQYQDQYDNAYSVDSGTLGIVSVDHPAVDKLKLDKFSPFRFEKPFDVDAINGLFIFGDIHIDTRED